MIITKNKILFGMMILSLFLICYIFYLLGEYLRKEYNIIPEKKDEDDVVRKINGEK